MNYSVLRIPDVIAKTGLSRSTIYVRIKNDQTFPKPISLGDRAIGFLESEINDWIAVRIEKSRTYVLKTATEVSE